MDSTLADELDREANVKTIKRVAEQSRRRFPGKKGDDLYKEVVRQLRHWRPDIPEDQIREVMLGSAPAEADGRRPAGPPA